MSEYFLSLKDENQREAVENVYKMVRSMINHINELSISDDDPIFYSGVSSGFRRILRSLESALDDNRNQFIEVSVSTSFE